MNRFNFGNQSASAIGGLAGMGAVVGKSIQRRKEQANTTLTNSNSVQRKLDIAQQNADTFKARQETETALSKSKIKLNNAEARSLNKMTKSINSPQGKDIENKINEMIDYVQNKKTDISQYTNYGGVAR